MLYGNLLRACMGACLHPKLLGHMLHACVSLGILSSVLESGVQPCKRIHSRIRFLSPQLPLLSVLCTVSDQETQVDSTKFKVQRIQFEAGLEAGGCWLSIQRSMHIAKLANLVARGSINH